MFHVISYSLITIIILFPTPYMIFLYQGIFHVVNIIYGTIFSLVAFVTLILNNNWDVQGRLTLIFLLMLWGITIASFPNFPNYGKDEITHEIP